MGVNSSTLCRYAEWATNVTWAIRWRRSKPNIFVVAFATSCHDWDGQNYHANMYVVGAELSKARIQSSEVVSAARSGLSDVPLRRIRYTVPDVSVET